MTLDVFTQQLKDGVAALAGRTPPPQYPVGTADWSIIATGNATVPSGSCLRHCPDTEVSHTSGCDGMCRSCQVRSSLLNYDREA